MKTRVALYMKVTDGTCHCVYVYDKNMCATGVASACPTRVTFTVSWYVPYDDLEVTLVDEQSDELSSIVSKIDETSADELEKIFKEADGCSVGDFGHAV